MERLRVGNGHLPPGEYAWTDKSGCGKDPSGRGRGLESTDRWTDKSGCRKNPSERGALTTSAVHAADMFRPCLVQTNRDQDTERIWAGGTHFCKHRWTSQDVEREGLRWEKGREGRVA